MIERSDTIKRALLSIDRLQRRVDELEHARREPIAIVGMACRFPGGSDTPESYWKLLRKGGDAIREIPADRPELRGLYDPNPEAPGRMYMQAAGFLDRIDGFDAPFFRISPREAVQMDPQQRLFLEVAWEALEDAGQRADGLEETRTGVFAGVLSTDYAHLPVPLKDRIDAHYYPGVSASFLAGRLSYILGLQGQSVCVDTACSSSLVAVHLAVQSLRTGESDLALAGGVNLILTPETSMFLCKAQVMSPTGRCRAFDEEADGMIRGEGCGIIVLKRLSDALEAGDNILALVKGTAVNHDGASGGLTVPSPQAQERVYRRALANADLEPSEVVYVEAHGTGTNLGDPVELEGLSTTYGKGKRPDDEPLLIGSVKTNIGHTDSAAGIAGLIKSALILKHGEIPPSLYIRNPNPQFAWDRNPIRVADKVLDLPTSDSPPAVGISSFGLSGTNSHVILQAAPTVERDTETSELGRRNLLCLSAKSETALEALAGRFATHFENRDGENTDDDVTDACFTANAGRARFQHRVALTGSDGGELAEGLRAVSRGETSQHAISAAVPERRNHDLVFLFTGQGSQRPGMGRNLYEREPVFRAAFDRCNDALREHLEHPLLAVLDPESEHSGLLNETAYTQPALFSLEYALAELWRSWGIEPAAVLGHSVGDYAAACVAGVFGVEDGLRLIAARGRLMQALPRNGSMVAVMSDEERVRTAIQRFEKQGHENEVSVATVNGPQSVVIAGLAETVQKVAGALEADGLRTKPLNVSHAFHSPLMDPMLEEFAQIAREVEFHEPTVPFLSNLATSDDSAGPAAPGTLNDPEYWVRHVRDTVHFERSVRWLAEEGFELFLELGPAATLLGMARGCADFESAAWLSSLHADRPGSEHFLRTAGELYCAGLELDWDAIAGPGSHRKQSLPKYPFERQRFWIHVPKAAKDSLPAHSGSTLLGVELPSPLEDDQFTNAISVESPIDLRGHDVGGTVVFPAAGYLDLALEASARMGATATEIGELNLSAPLLLTDESKVVQTTVSSADGEGRHPFRVFSTDGSTAGTWALHASGWFRPLETDSSIAEDTSAELEALRNRLEPIEAGAFYDEVSESGYAYREAFRSIRDLWLGEREALSRVELVEGTSVPEGAATHPAVFDGCLHTLLAATRGDADVYVPQHFDRCRLPNEPLSEVWSHVRLEDASDADAIVAHFRLFDGSGHMVGQIDGLTLKRLASWGPAASADPGMSFEIGWQAAEISEYSGAPAGQAGEWLIFGGDDDATRRLLEFLPETQPFTLIRKHGDQHGEPASNGSNTRAIAPSDSTGFTELFSELGGRKRPIRHIVYLWGDATATGGSGDANVAHDVTESCGGLLHLVQGLMAAEWPDAPRLWIATTDSQAIMPDDLATGFAATSLWGLGRVIALEHPELRPVCIDLDSRAGDQSSLLVREIESNDDERQIALRGADRYVARLRAADLPQLAKTDGDSPVQVRIPQYGILDRLRLEPLERTAPGAGEVEIEVTAAGLNFRDVLSALGMLEEYAKSLGVETASDMRFGFECAGRISAIGDNVSDLKIGDRVVAGLATGSFASHVNVRSEFVAPVPDGLDDTEAATLPIAFLTAYYALHHIAKIRKGDRVLVHCAAGGVGQAAVQLAQQAGAEVFATASPKKWETVHGLGVEHVMNSRELGFAEELRTLTDGHGVDLVLNSLKKDFASEGLGVCSPEGRFVEIGKADILAPEEAADQRPDVDYTIFDLETAAHNDPEGVRVAFRELIRLVESGSLKPLPHQSFPLEEVAEAFRFMAQARHTGKIVLEAPSTASGPSPIREDASYLLVGGFGALGLRVADWLVDRGAKHIALSGRSAPSADAEAALESLRQRGVEVMALAADVTSTDDVEGMLTEIASTMPPLRGVIHLAAVLDDGILLRQSWERLERVLGPKVRGSWNLHRISESQPLDFFVCFSSTVALLGAPGQGSYSAGNAFMDGLAHYRQASGAPGASINWGPWAETGLAADISERDQQRWASRGVESIPPERGIEVLEQVIVGKRSQVGVLPVDWAKYRDQLPDDGGRNFLTDVAGAPASGDSTSATAGLAQQLENADPDDRRDVLLRHLREQVAAVLGLGTPEKISLRQRLFDLGLDSLMALELQNRIEASVASKLRSTLIFDYPTVEALADHLSTGVLVESFSAPTAEGSDDAAEATGTEDAGEEDSTLDELSEDELAELLAQEISAD